MIPQDLDAEREVAGCAVATVYGCELVLRHGVDARDFYRPELARLFRAAVALADVPIVLRSTEIRTIAAATIADVSFLEAERIVQGRTFQADPGGFAARLKVAARQRQALLEHRQRSAEIEALILAGDAEVLGVAS